MFFNQTNFESCLGQAWMNRDETLKWTIIMTTAEKKIFKNLKRETFDIALTLENPFGTTKRAVSFRENFLTKSLKIQKDLSILTVFVILRYHLFLWKKAFLSSILGLSNS